MIRMRMGSPDSLLTSEVSFQLTTCSSESPKISGQSSIVSPLIELPDGRCSSILTEPAADVEKFSTRFFPSKIRGFVRISPPPEAARTEQSRRSLMCRAYLRRPAGLDVASVCLDAHSMLGRRSPNRRRIRTRYWGAPQRFRLRQRRVANK